ncbi:MAG: 4Fe-4S dicluster domain-containing protein [Promethearchaeota archaeon]
MPELYRDETKNKRLMLQKELCKGCNLCFEVCPVHCIQLGTELNNKVVYPPAYKPVDGKNCIFCENCMITCPDFAIYIVEGME